VPTIASKHRPHLAERDDYFSALESGAAYRILAILPLPLIRNPVADVIS
jgi:hypothetical protein